LCYGSIGDNNENCIYGNRRYYFNNRTSGCSLTDITHDTFFTGVSILLWKKLKKNKSRHLDPDEEETSLILYFYFPVMRILHICISDDVAKT